MKINILAKYGMVIFMQGNWDIIPKTFLNPLQRAASGMGLKYFFKEANKIFGPSGAIFKGTDNKKNWGGVI